MPLWLILIIIILLVLVGIALLVVLLVLRPDIIDRFLNKVVARPPYTVDPGLWQKHQGLFIVDLHADPLLWARNLLEKHDYGHVDLPRLVEGNVALQVCGVVTQYTVGANHPANGLDLIPPLVWAQRWPSSTWASPLQRALYQAERLRGFVQGSGGALMLIRSAQDINQLVAGRQGSSKLTGALLSLEGAHALEGNIDNLDVLYNANFRMIGLTHFSDNEAGGSSAGQVEGGITPFGAELVKRIQQKRMIVDLAHASKALIDNVLAITQAPLVVSHAGVLGIYSGNPRNLSDQHIQGVANTGGVIGIAMFKIATGSDEIEDAARAMRYVADLVGVEHVALGVDFDGVIRAPVDASGLPFLTGALLDIGFTLGETEKIMGGNALRVLRQILPAS